MFRLEIRTIGASFEDGRTELVRILRQLADKVAGGDDEGGGIVKESNGNRCGEWDIRREYN